jgi:hypothetical protein
MFPFVVNLTKLLRHRPDHDDDDDDDGSNPILHEYPIRNGMCADVPCCVYFLDSKLFDSIETWIPLRR